MCTHRGHILFEGHSCGNEMGLSTCLARPPGIGGSRQGFLPRQPWRGVGGGPTWVTAAGPGPATSLSISCCRPLGPPSSRGLLQQTGYNPKRRRRLPSLAHCLSWCGTEPGVGTGVGWGQQQEGAGDWEIGAFIQWKWSLSARCLG